MITKTLLGAITVTSVVALSMAWSPTWAADSASQTFIKAAVEGNLAEVEMGKLAQQKGQSEGVKSFGKMLETDHGEGAKKSADIAKSLGVTAPTAPNAEQKADRDKLAKLPGGAFDQAFAKAMVEDHQKDIKEYQTESKQSDAAGSYAKETLPTLQKHLKTAQDLASGKTTGQGMNH